MIWWDINYQPYTVLIRYEMALSPKMATNGKWVAKASKSGVPKELGDRQSWMVARHGLQRNFNGLLNIYIYIANSSTLRRIKQIWKKQLICHYFGWILLFYLFTCRAGNAMQRSLHCLCIPWLCIWSDGSCSLDGDLQCAGGMWNWNGLNMAGCIWWNTKDIQYIDLYKL